MIKPTLLIMAAGIGSRYGGLKQIDGVGPNGETIIEYSIYDAIRSGFDKIVIIIRKDIEQDFREIILKKIDPGINIHFVYQEITDLPKNFKAPQNRQKPWGTGHAIWSARKEVQDPFLVINADDFYGYRSFQLASSYLSKISKTDVIEYSLIGYHILNTLSKHGGVTRAVCSVNTKSYLDKINEVEGIELKGNEVFYLNEENKKVDLNATIIVSMNMWAFFPVFFNQLEKSLCQFLNINIQDIKSEFLIPTVIENLIMSNKARIKVLNSDEEWIGMTFHEDKPEVRKRIDALIKKGIYPKRLWLNS